jgi:hypothetical protein
MKEEDRKTIRKLIGTMKCPKNFKCAENGFEDLCQTRDFGDEHRLHCLEEASTPCPFCEVHTFGVDFRFCQCPLRVYLAKHLQI